jgi:hypothetical protein
MHPHTLCIEFLKPLKQTMTEQEHETYLRFHYASSTAVLDTTRPEEKQGLLRSLPDGVATTTKQHVGDEVVGWTIKAPLHHFGHAFEAACDGDLAHGKKEFSR